jgi:DNA-binding transcriptional regulator YhcF (GntR family)
MRSIFEKIQELEGLATYSKHDQFVQGIINAIDDKIIVKGDSLPSVNAMIRELGFARETVMKGYRDLISRGIIESKNRLGFFVANNKTNLELKVALLMFSFDSFQEQFYHSFREELGPNIHLDVFFHHNNIEIFETILKLIEGKYGVYVVSPLPHPKTKKLLNVIPRKKLYIFDRHEALGGTFNYVTQEFENSSFTAFADLAKDIKKYDELIFFHLPGTIIPAEIITAFKKFLQQYKVKGKMLPQYEPGSVEKGKAYFTIENPELWRILKDCKKKKLQPGKDVGILSHNDEPVKEVMDITTYSTDFSLMGKRVAEAILNKSEVQETIPTVLIKRKSL